jgi:hypothetical protein
VRPSEAIAKLVLEAVLPGAKMAFRSEQSHGEWDFDLRYANGTVAAVEVTASVDQDQARMSARIRDKRKGGSSIAATKCKKSWMIFPTKDADINIIRAEADEYLSALEQAQVQSFSFLEAFTFRSYREAGIERFLPFQVPQCVEDICFNLKIMSGSAISDTTASQILIQHSVRGGAVRASVATDAGEREASKDDNRRKLGAAGTGERHLVVYIDVMNGLPWTALTDFTPPSSCPVLPPEITDIWLIAHAGIGDEFVAWRASAQEPWHSQRVVIPQYERRAS